MKYFDSVRIKKTEISFYFEFYKTLCNFSETCANRILRPDMKRSRWELFKTGLKIVLASLNQNLEDFAKNDSFILSNPLQVCVCVCVCVWLCMCMWKVGKKMQYGCLANRKKKCSMAAYNFFSGKVRFLIIFDVFRIKKNASRLLICRKHIFFYFGFFWSFAPVCKRCFWVFFSSTQLET